MKTLKLLKSISNQFFDLCEKSAKEKPWIVCLAMHEYMRNIYPEDPYIIPLQERICPTERLYNVVEYLIDFLKISNNFGHYKIKESYKENIEIKTRTGKIYGNLWSKFTFENLTNNALEILKERFFMNNIEFLKNKDVIDIGCGSGRFTFALKKLGCKSVIGVDYGDKGLEIAGDILQKTGINGVEFLKNNILDLSFEDEKFDFVFCNGVLHHSEDLEKGLKEMVRVAKYGAKIWLYLYGDGGIFWYARKKMPLIMKAIPQEYTMNILDIIGMPKDRFIFCDNWYVPIEKHNKDKEIRNILKDLGIKKIHRLKNGRSTDLEYWTNNNSKAGKIMWGEGELRYILDK